MTTTITDARPQPVRAEGEHALYDHVRTLDEGDIDFAVNTTPFKMDYACTWLGATLSHTLLFFYGILLATAGLETLV